MDLLPLYEGECSCCATPHLIGWHMVARASAPALSYRFRAADGISDENGEDAFLDDELSIAASLSGQWLKLGSEAATLLLGAVARGYKPGNFQIALDESETIMGKLFDGAEDTVRQSVANVLEIGEAKILPGGIGRSPTAKAFEAGIIQATRYHTNTFFKREIVPKIVKGLDDINSKAVLAAPVLEDIQNAIAKHFKTVPYWQLVANVAASRGFHYGMLKTMEQTGIIGYRLRAVIDGKTSRICKELNGREFLVSSAVRLLEDLGTDPSPRAAHEKTPWVSVQVAQGRSSEELARMGVMVPPFHGHCRTSLDPIY